MIHPDSEFETYLQAMLRAKKLLKSAYEEHSPLEKILWHYLRGNVDPSAEIAIFVANSKPGEAENISEGTLNDFVLKEQQLELWHNTGYEI